MRLELNGLEFHVEIEGRGPPLLLLHGFTGSVRSWDDIRPRLARFAQVIAVDLIGHGQSAGPASASRYTLDWCTRDLLQLLEALHLPRVDVLGYSMGGRVALHFALTAAPHIRHLILESASPGIEDAAERGRRVQSDAALAERILTNGVEAFVAEWEQQPLLMLQPHVAQAVLERQHALRLSNDPGGLANSLLGMGAGQQVPLWSRLGELDMPVLLIVGQADARYLAIAERTRSALPNAELVVVPAAGHTAHLDQPETFMSVVEQTLTNRVTPADCTLSTN
jgi:2-succinyl-6-hydroxy-2,4-cyclohexadiene-1-carboxylate synthase